MSILLGVLGTQEILIILLGIIPLSIFLILIPYIAYRLGKKKGLMEGKMEEMEKNRQK